MNNWVWYPYMFFGDKVKGKREKILKNLQSENPEEPSKSKKLEYVFQEGYRNLTGEETPDWMSDEEELYLITVSLSSDLLDIYPKHSIYQGYYLNRKMYILGIARGHKDACETAGKIMERYLMGTADSHQSVREYFFKE